MFEQEGTEYLVSAIPIQKFLDEFPGAIWTHLPFIIKKTQMFLTVFYIQFLIFCHKNGLKGYFLLIIKQRKKKMKKTLLVFGVMAALAMPLTAFAKHHHHHNKGFFHLKMALSVIETRVFVRIPRA